MTPTRSFIASLYLMAALLVLVPLAEATSSVWPFRPGEVIWRYGAAGLYSRVLVTPLLGVLLASGTAVVFKHARTLRVFSVAAFAGALVLALWSGLFVLDALQMRPQVHPAGLAPFYAASLQALARMGLCAVLAGLIARGAWVMSRSKSAARAWIFPRKHRIILRHGEVRAEPVATDRT